MDPAGTHAGTTESATLDFKANLNPDSTQDWCELVKDIVAMANSGGGTIVFGVNDDGTLSGADLQPILNVDPAIITDKVRRYTEHQFSAFSIAKVEHDGSPVVALVIQGLRTPLVFANPGTYDAGGGKQKTAFAKGTVYFGGQDRRWRGTHRSSTRPCAACGNLRCAWVRAT